MHRDSCCKHLLQIIVEYSHPNQVSTHKKWTVTCIMWQLNAITLTGCTKNTSKSYSKSTMQFLLCAFVSYRHVIVLELCSQQHPSQQHEIANYLTNWYKSNFCYSCSSMDLQWWIPSKKISFYCRTFCHTEMRLHHHVDLLNRIGPGSPLHYNSNNHYTIRIQ